MTTDPQAEQNPGQPSGIRDEAIRALEWIRFLDLATLEARSEPGRDRLRQLAEPSAWASDLATSRVLQQQTQEMLPLLDRDGLWGPLAELTDPEASLDRLGRGSVLELTELVLARRWLYAVDSWRQFPRDDIRGERFARAVSSLMDAQPGIRVLDRVLTPEGELSERASPKLGQLNSEIRSLKREIAIVLDGLMKTFSQKGVIQDNITDVRDGRYVIPVKISSQNEVEGIIYEASASRQTVFVEPREVAALNNRLRQRQNDLLQEIFIILQDTSAKLRPYADELSSAVLVISHWDAAQARARFGGHFSGKSINVTEERVFKLERTAHPLLWWAIKPESIIRNEVDFGEPVRSLLITGPNTGGKTVLLKTLGLAGICARTGFPFPGSDSPTVPFFDSFFADLGDPQSIEQHLSSFSGHIKRFREVLEHATDRSLVLLDELNTSTDPDEGAALGRAFLETVMGRGALVITTTHDPHLKALAINDKRILNASMAFDESARTPTYRIVLGVPGRSRALETAARLGMPESVLVLARGYLSTEHIEFEKVLAKMEADTAEAASARLEAVTLRDEALRLKKEWTERTELEVGEMLDRTRQRLRRVLEQAQEEVRASVKRLDESMSRKEMSDARARISESFTIATAQIDSALHEEAPHIAEMVADTLAEREAAARRETPAAPKLAVGTTVRVPKWKNTGQILEIIKGSGGSKLKVAIGSVQITLGIGEVELMSADETSALRKMGASNRSGKSRVMGLDVHTPDNRIDLRGQRLEEAMSNLEPYLDLAFRSGALAEVTIVHGLGTGAIREATRKLLKRLPYVRGYTDDGNAGATRVEFDRD